MQFQPRAFLTDARVAGSDRDRAELDGFAQMACGAICGDFGHRGKLYAFARRRAAICECAEQDHRHQKHNERDDPEQDFLQHWPISSRHIFYPVSGPTGATSTVPAIKK